MAKTFKRFLGLEEEGSKSMSKVYIIQFIVAYLASLPKYFTESCKFSRNFARS